MSVKIQKVKQKLNFTDTKTISTTAGSSTKTTKRQNDKEGAERATTKFLKQRNKSSVMTKQR